MVLQELEFKSHWDLIGFRWSVACFPGRKRSGLVQNNFLWRETIYRLALKLKSQRRPWSWKRPRSLSWATGLDTNRWPCWGCVVPSRHCSCRDWPGGFPIDFIVLFEQLVVNGLHLAVDRADPAVQGWTALECGRVFCIHDVDCGFRHYPYGSLVWLFVWSGRAWSHHRKFWDSRIWHHIFLL